MRFCRQKLPKDFQPSRWIWGESTYCRFKGWKSHGGWCLNIHYDWIGKKKQTVWSEYFSHIKENVNKRERGLERKREKQKANSIWCSQAVTHQSTNQTQRCSTSLIGREAVHSTWYGRWRRSMYENALLCLRDSGRVGDFFHNQWFLWLIWFLSIFNTFI